MKSHIMRCGIYAAWISKATPEQVAFVDDVYAFAEPLYSHGGDHIVECYSPDDILRELKTIDDAKAAIGAALAGELNARWGDDNDDALERYNGFREATR